MNCEYCGKVHNGEYGSGRFCSKKCACGFSTKTKRKEINKKVSESLRGKKRPGSGFANPKNTKNRFLFTKESRERAILVKREKIKSLSFEEAPLIEKRRRILREQNGVCLLCGINSWKGKELILELDHINGNHFDNRRENLRILCPNCHSQTPTYRNRSRELDVVG